MNIKELHDKKKSFEQQLVALISKELSEFAEEGVVITGIDVDFDNVWSANSETPIKILRSVVVNTSI